MDEREEKVLTVEEVKADPNYNEYQKTMSYGEAARACQRDLTASIIKAKLSDMGDEAVKEEVAHILLEYRPRRNITPKEAVSQILSLIALREQKAREEVLEEIEKHAEENVTETEWWQALKSSK